ncbi:PepSY domain-containing protein [Ruminococcus sp. 5_1_39BFAA]|uniref:PepSY domain-containing protein n=1 Tax=Ruminococcus sp. 5_1_39BFAA TaxID=457412 RepID=UPI00356B397F
MRKTNLFNGKNVLAAGILGVMIVFGANTALAAEEKAVVQNAGGAAVDAEGAEEIAFADAGVTADKAERLRTKAERENGESVYEVSFTVDGIEYEYMIREDDGTILEWEMDGRDIGDAVAEESLKDSLKEAADSNKESAASKDTLIGLEKAKEIALSDAGLDAAKVSFSKIKFEKGNHEVVYEVEFYQDRDEFEYTIDAYSGEVLKMERD